MVEFACTNFLDNFVKRKKASNEAKEKEREAKAEVFRKKQERSIAKAVKQVLWSLISPKLWQSYANSGAALSARLP